MAKPAAEPDPRMVQRDAVRHAADDLNTGSNLEAILARISVQMTEQARNAMTCTRKQHSSGQQNPLDKPQP